MAILKSYLRNVVFAYILISKKLIKIKANMAEILYYHNKDLRPINGLPRQEINLPPLIGVRHLYRLMGMEGQSITAL